MTTTLLTLALIFTQLSLLAFGGGNSILPEMHRQIVDVQHWMTAQEFGALFALAQAAPGPNLMVVPLVGWHVAGWAGVLVTSAAKFGPSSVLTYFVLHLWNRFKDRPWRRIVQAGLVSGCNSRARRSCSLDNARPSACRPRHWRIGWLERHRPGIAENRPAPDVSGRWCRGPSS